MLALVAAQNDSVFSGVRDFFNSGTWLLVRNLSLFFVVVFWLAVAYWVFKDARRRIEDPWLVAMATRPRAGAAVHRRVRLHALPAARVPRGGA